MIGLMVLAAALTEGSANDWLALSVVDGFSTSDAVGALAFGIFVASMTAMRFAGHPPARPLRPGPGAAAVRGPGPRRPGRVRPRPVAAPGRRRHRAVGLRRGPGLPRGDERGIGRPGALGRPRLGGVLDRVRRLPRRAAGAGHARRPRRLPDGAADDRGPAGPEPDPEPGGRAAARLAGRHRRRASAPDARRPPSTARAGAHRTGALAWPAAGARGHDAGHDRPRTTPTPPPTPCASGPRRSSPACRWPTGSGCCPGATSGPPRRSRDSSRR